MNNEDAAAQMERDPPSTDAPSSVTANEPSVEHVWDKSNRKVVIQNVTKYHDQQTVSRMVDEWLEGMHKISMELADNKSSVTKIEVERVKKAPKATWMVVTLKDEAMVQPMIDFINTKGFRNKKGGRMYAKQSNTDERENERIKHSTDGDCIAEDESRKRPRTSDELLLQEARRPISVEEIKDCITPLWRLTPEQQLESKTKEMIRKCAQKIVKEIHAKFR